MNVFKLVFNDITEGVIKNKRFISVPLVSIFACMVADIKINNYIFGCQLSVKRTAFDVFAEIFHGIDPLIRQQSFQLPYMWIGIFMCILFIAFDYINKDISQFGIQVVTRLKSRKEWWYSKCISNIVTSLCYYLIFIAVVIIFCLINRYDLSLQNTPEISQLLSTSGIYSYKQLTVFTNKEVIIQIVSPLILLITLNLMQMMLSLIIKPAYSIVITMGILLIGLFIDNVYAFSRMGMCMMSNIYYTDGYDLIKGSIVCIVIIITSISLGACIFERYDILPGKE